MTTDVGSGLHTPPAARGKLAYTHGQDHSAPSSNFAPQRAVHAQEPSDNVQTLRRRPLRVLLVEDSLLIRKHLVSLLEDTDGVTVCGEVDTEADAITALRVGRFDAVVVDLQLREGSGFGVLQHLKLNHPGLLAIVLTNSNSPGMRTRSLASGAHHFLDKSSEFERVAELLEGLR